MLRARVLFAGVLCVSPMLMSQAPGPPQTGPEARASSQAAALRADLDRMRVLVGQMERNLAALGSGPTPLKHQFQLEIEMWNLLINDMQRRVDALNRPGL